MTALVSVFLMGVIFALGLGFGGMTRPATVIAFLDVAGHWDPSLAFVMAGAVGTYALWYRATRRSRRPLFAPAFVLPPRRDVDLQLVVGAAIFGLGWGIAGYCPGPAIVALASGASAPLVFVGAMLGGMALVDYLLDPSYRAVGRARRVVVLGPLPAARREAP